MLSRILKVAVAAAVAVALTIPASAAAQDKGAVVSPCRDAPGTVVVTPGDDEGGNVNINCGFPGPSAGGGAVVVPWGENLRPCREGDRRLHAERSPQVPLRVPLGGLAKRLAKRSSGTW